MSFPEVVDVEFSSRCNLKCGFCFGPTDDRSVPELPTQFWITALEWLSQYGAKGVVISGGEPTIYRDIVELLSKAKSLGLSIVVSTHGQFHSKVLACIPYADWVALPVDGVSEETLLAMRGRAWNLEAAMLLIKEIRKIKPEIGIKLGSVATKVNIHELPLLAKSIVSQKPDIDTWKIYQYTPRRQFAHRAEEYRISDELFRSLAEDVKLETANYPLRIVFSSNRSREQAYLFVYPDGSVTIPNHGKHMTDFVVGNLFMEGRSVLDRVSGLNLDLHKSNYQSTYGSSRNDERTF